MKLVTRARVLWSLLLCFALAACGSNDGPSPDAGSDSAPPSDSRPQGLTSLVSELVTPHVDPSKSSDLSKAIGMVVGVAVDGEQHTFGFGATEANGTQTPDGDTVFQLGSVTKALTGLMLARLVVDDTNMKPSSSIRPLLPAALGDPSSVQAVTLAQVASHYGGFPYYPTNMRDRNGDNIPDPEIDRLSPAEGYSMAHLGEFLAADPLEAPPGTKYIYSNAGSGVLGVALVNHHQVANFHALLRQQLGDPLAIGDLWGQVNALDASALSRVIQGYALDESETARIPGRTATMGVLPGGGEALATGKSMTMLLAALSGQVQSPLDSAIELALQPLEPIPGNKQIGYSIEIESGGETTTYEKSGSVSSYSAYIAFRREPAVGVVVLANVGKFQRVGEIAHALLDALTATP